MRYRYCFDAMVVDTSCSVTVNHELHYKVVCECFSMEDAQLICDALNAKDRLQATTYKGATHVP